MGDAGSSPCARAGEGNAKSQVKSSSKIAERFMESASGNDLNLTKNLYNWRSTFYLGFTRRGHSEDC
jgi:hypothetical protein